MRELILSNNKRLYHGAQSATDRTAATADTAETSVRQRAAGMEGGSDGDGDGDRPVPRGGAGMVAAACGMARAIVATRDGFGEGQGGGDVGGNAGEGGG